MARDVMSNNQLSLLGGRQEFEPKDASDDEGKAEEAEGCVRFAEEEHSDEGGAGGTNAGPNGVACTDRDRFKGVGKQEETGDHEGDGGHAGPDASKALRILEADGLCDFE